MKDTPILFTPENAQKSHDGIKTNTRRIIKGEAFAIIHDLASGSSVEDPSPLSFQYVKDCQRLNDDGGEPYPYTGLLVSLEEYPEEGFIELPCPFGTMGDRLYIKEAHYRWGRWMRNGHTTKGRPRWRFRCNPNAPLKFILNATDKRRQIRITDKKIWGWQKRSPLFMPKKAARLWLELTGVRVERVQEISEKDACAEGVELLEGTMNPDDFTGIWKNYDPQAPEPYWNSPIDSFHSLWTSINGKDSWDLNPWVWVLEYKTVQP